MSVSIIQIAMNVELARCENGARTNLDRYLATGKLVYAVRFDREAEAQQVLAYRADAAASLARAWRK